jgi:hypothetical protein
MATPLLIKENIAQPFFNQTNNTCYNDISYSQMEYTNTGVNKWTGSNYILDYMKLQKNIDLGSQTIKNECTDIDITTLKNIPADLKNSGSANIKLSNDNIRLMSPCDFTTNINPVTRTQCLETMANINEPTYSSTKMTNFEKGYLAAFTILIVGILYKANHKMTFRS